MRKAALVFVLALATLAAAWLLTLSASPLPAPEPYAGDLPPASPPQGMHVYRIPTGVTHRSAAFGYRGGSLFEKRDFAMNAVLVTHPSGGLLIDTGFGHDIDSQFRTLPWIFRALTPYTAGTPAADQLKAAGLDHAFSAILLTHAHWDHVSGIPDFPGTPVLVNPVEHRYIASAGAVMELTRQLKDVHYQEYEFDGGPYFGFPRSHDVYGDGSVVVVPMPGHTPGSVVVFVTESGGKRWALVGDLVWQREGIVEREERPFLQRMVADYDADGVRAGILRMAAIAERFPEITIVPAHDQRCYETMAALPAVNSGEAAPGRR